MGVASHLGISLDEYDARIRTFIPYYEEMIATAAATLRALGKSKARIVDLGIGSGALAAACARVVSDISVTGIDADAGILEQARARLQQVGITATLVHGNFTDVTLPACDAVVSSFALHHIRDTAERRKLFRMLHHVVSDGGLLVFVDCHPSTDTTIAQIDREAWRAHLRRAYGEAEADAFLAAWAEEDSYTTLADETAMLGAAGFTPHVVWRRDSFAVVAARR